MTTFNIRDQEATTIQNVGGDMVVNGGFSSSTGSQIVELRGELSRLAEELGRLDLSPEQRETAERELAGAAAEAESTEPDEGRIAGRLERLTQVLHDAGALAGGGLVLAQSVQRLGELLGPAGHTLLGLVAAL
jgi:hypothetical protein